MKKRAIVIVMDSVGIGALPDASKYGDSGSHTLGNIYRVRGRLNLPSLYALGLAHIEDSRLPNPDMPPAGSYGRAAEITAAKDTTSGHWELMGVPMEVPFRTYPNGFSQELMREFEHRIGRGTLGNCVASGTEIIQRLGMSMRRQGSPSSIPRRTACSKLPRTKRWFRLTNSIVSAKSHVNCLQATIWLVASLRARFWGPAAHINGRNRRDYAVPPRMIQCWTDLRGAA